VKRTARFLCVDYGVNHPVSDPGHEVTSRLRPCNARSGPKKPIGLTELTAGATVASIGVKRERATRSVGRKARERVVAVFGGIRIGKTARFGDVPVGDIRPENWPRLCGRPPEGFKESVKGRRKRVAARNGAATFDFLGFTHICARSRRGKFTVNVRTMKKRLRRGLTAIAEWCQEHRHEPVEDSSRPSTQNSGVTANTTDDRRTPEASGSSTGKAEVAQSPNSREEVNVGEV
jgi:hypothetical protein